jgi:tetratricopeptide (TPR) repeat protein
LQALDRHAAALVSYDRALALRPDYVEALNNRGNALRALARYQDAIDSYARALALCPDSRQARVNQGNVLQILDRHDAALACYDSVLAARLFRQPRPGAWDAVIAKVCHELRDLPSLARSARGGSNPRHTTEIPEPP